MHAAGHATDPKYCSKVASPIGQCGPAEYGLPATRLVP